jgi:hypothetical protein
MLNILKGDSLIQSTVGTEAVALLEIQMDFLLKKDNPMVSSVKYVELVVDKTTNYYVTWLSKGEVYSMHVMGIVEPKMVELCHS